MNSAAMCAPRLARAKLSASGPRTLLEEFSYADVSLNPGVMSSLAQAQFEQTQAVMLATDQMFFLTSLAFVVAAIAVWLSPKPNIAGMSMGAGGGH